MTEHQWALFALTGSFAVCVALISAALYRSFTIWRDSKPRRD